MIKANNAIRTARLMLGTPYSDVDCIRLIVMVIRRTAGGVTDYRCEGTNWLWRSINNSGKYRHLTWRQESTDGAKPGMLAFKCEGDNIHHVGLVTERRTVIHSSSVYGQVVETELDNSWDLLAQHRYIELGEMVAEPEETPSVPAGHLPQDGGSGEAESAFTSLVRDDGTSIMLAGRWRVAQD